MEALQEALGYTFQNPELLKTALTHSSYANERSHEKMECNERLEFLGDAILGFVSADRLYHRYPSMPEGRMTRLRADFVCEQALFKVAEKLELGRCLRLGKGEELTGGRERPSILCDAVEAVIAAIYLDSGFDAAADFIQREILCDLPKKAPGCSKDYKSALQEELQKVAGTAFCYELISESGPDHAKVFEVRVLINGKEAAVGCGHSKKEAEQEAARLALEKRK